MSRTGRRTALALLAAVALLGPSSPAALANAPVAPPAVARAEASAFGVVVTWDPAADGATGQGALVSRSTDGGATWAQVATVTGVDFTERRYADPLGLPPSGTASYRVQLVQDGQPGAPSSPAAATRAPTSLLVEGIAGFTANGEQVTGRGSMGPQGLRAGYFFPSTASGGWATSPDGQEVLMVAGGGTADRPYRLLRLGARGSSAEPATVARTFARPVMEMSWAPDGQTLAWLERDHSTSTSILMWGPVGGTSATVSTVRDVSALSWLPDSRTLVMLSLGVVTFLDTVTGQEVRTSVSASGMALHPDGRHLLVKRDDASLTTTTYEMYDLDPNLLTVTSPRVTTRSYEPALQPVISPDGRSVLSRGYYDVLTAELTAEGPVGPWQSLAPGERVQWATWQAYRPTLSPQVASGRVTALAITPGALAAGTTYRCALDSGTAAPCSTSWTVPSGLDGGRHTLSVTATEPTGRTVFASRTWTVGSGRFTPAGPRRVLDTRVGTGAPRAKLGPGQTLTLTVAGLPADATAAVLNVTATRPTADTYVTVYPADRQRPATSTLNVSAGVTRANLTSVAVAPGGKVRITNASGSVDLLADLVGWYRPGPGAGFTPVTPRRVLDTRKGLGAPTGRLAAGGEATVMAADSPASAAVLTATATGTTGTGYFTVYPNSTAVPNASTLNYTEGSTVANLALVKVDQAGLANLANFGSSAHAIADVTGLFTAAGATYTSVTPRRLLDTRTGVGLPRAARVRAGQTLTLTVPGLPAGAGAVVLNVTAVRPDTAGYLSTWPADVSDPGTSTVNFGARQTVAAPTAVAVDDEGRVMLRNGGLGSTDIVVDLSGYYAF